MSRYEKATLILSRCRTDRRDDRLDQGLGTGGKGHDMKAQDFLSWMDAVGARFGTDVMDILGLSRNTATQLVTAAKAGQDLDIKRTVALAMSATAQKLRPWDDYER